MNELSKEITIILSTKALGRSPKLEEMNNLVLGESIAKPLPNHSEASPSIL